VCSTYKFERDFPTRSEVKRLYWLAKKESPGSRGGESFWNKYGKPTESFPELFQEDSDDRAIGLIVKHIQEYKEFVNSGFSQFN
jgi:hypothetical protein